MKGVGGFRYAGNVKLNFIDWNVDFASWCSYKYEFRTGNASDVLSMKNTIIMHSYPDLQAGGDITKNAVSRWNKL
jgi:hypothetical protein